METGQSLDIRKKSNELRAISVELGGVKLRLRSSLEESYVRELIQIADQKIRQCLPATKIGSVHNAALLALLAQIQETQELKRTALQEISEIQSDVQHLVSHLNHDDTAPAKSKS